MCLRWPVPPGKLHAILGAVRVALYHWTVAALGAALGALGACVPEGPKTDGDPLMPHFDFPTAVPRPAAASDPPLGARLSDDFERPDLGDDWYAKSPVWRIEAGQLCGMGAKNQGVWLKRRLPANARIEVEARSDSSEGDIKLELWGDGKSGATGHSYADATSYIAILGGWNNQLHVLARLDEHGDDRLVARVRQGATDIREQAVTLGRVYRFRIERGDDKTISWWVDDTLIHELADEAPLVGPGHDHLGFNNWQAHVCFDNLTITTL